MLVCHIIFVSAETKRIHVVIHVVFPWLSRIRFNDWVRPSFPVDDEASLFVYKVRVDSYPQSDSCGRSSLRRNRE